MQQPLWFAINFEVCLQLQKLSPDFFDLRHFTNETRFLIRHITRGYYPRRASLNADTKDIVNCLLPGIAANFKVDNVVDIIPQDIRMRAWDCDRRKHIVGQTEDDPRNWGVQFLKDLVTISRLNSGNLTEFQEKLRAKIVTHDDDHPWCRLADIKEIREDYEAPPPRAGEKIEVSSSDDSTSGDSYFEELAEPDRVPGKKGRKPRNHEVYEARPQKQPKKRKSKCK
jgi:hypothetical protein